MLNLRKVITSAPRKPEHVELQPLTTPWSEAVEPGEGFGTTGSAGSGEGGAPATYAPGSGRISNHPHPQFERADFQVLDGWWDYGIVPSDCAAKAWDTAPIPAAWDGRIRVPFSPEAPLSGVARQLTDDELLWYRRSFPCPTGFFEGVEAPSEQEGSKNRCILHFEAVDYACACYCNGVRAGTHIGGYLPFSFDITDALSSGENEIAVCVYDPSDKGVQLRGKQKLGRGGIWYTAQSGIWQTVWLEVVPASRIESLALDPDPDAGRLTLTVTVRDDAGESETGGSKTLLTATLFDGEKSIATASSTAAPSDAASPHTEPAPAQGAAVNAGVGAEAAQRNTGMRCRVDPAQEGQTTFVHTLAIDVADPHLWSPDDPHLYRLELTYGRDTVASYCAFRTVTMKVDEHGTSRLCINHEPCFLRGVLDQGYWPDGLMTAPSDDALIFDIEAMKDLGFNMLRKHIKIECDRWYYHCDRLGMLVWQDMVCGGSAPKPWYTSYKPTFFRWTWGRFHDGARHYRALSAEDDAFRAEWTETCTGTIGYLGNHPSIITWVLFNEAWGQFEAREATELVRQLDPTRPIDAVSGWYDQACGDFLSVHNYFRPLEVYKDSMQPKRAFVISEFGGLTFHLPEHSSLASSYGYETYSDLESYQAAVRETLACADELEPQGLAGFVYTQLSDVEEETNGLLTYDRRINKLDDEGGQL